MEMPSGSKSTMAYIGGKWCAEMDKRRRKARVETSGYPFAWMVPRIQLSAKFEMRPSTGEQTVSMMPFPALEISWILLESSDRKVD